MQMLGFDEFLSNATRSTSASIIDRPGTDVLVYMPVVMFPGGVAISEPISPRERDDVTPREREDTALEAAQHAFALERGYALYQETGDLREAMNVSTWTMGSTVSTEAGRQEATHCPATARLIAWLHYRLAAGYSDVVSVEEVLPTMLRLLRISQQPEVLEFVRSVPWPDGTLNLVTVEDFRTVLLDAIRPPRWNERRQWKWADVGNIAGTYLRRLREQNTEDELIAADTALTGGARADDVVAGLCRGKRFNGLEKAFWAYSYLSLMNYERKPKAWEKRLVAEVIGRAAEAGLSHSVSAGRKLNAVLAAASEARGVNATGDKRLPLPPRFEDEWVSVGAGSLELPETVPAAALTARQLVAKEIGDRALDEAVSLALSDFRKSVSDIEVGFSQVQASLLAALPDIRDIIPPVSLGPTAP